ncbi:LysR substrate-binding domain-containing protein [Streptomyces rapamycinicus]|nr:LysR substrate-binding domain-containing protein [Streptomyces rapamycinicus]MBB4783607.1 hypothetical protein [Streptomyces rapamycinicus]UTO63981.1 hypothetical protein LJB45_17705 [Streptomyces rapamycinicus]UTP31934.1 hypothetical protein LIV37_22820 [Streptomyces rapamycinicus NRRL 5491]
MTGAPNLGAVDWSLLTVSFGAITAIGLITKRAGHTTGDFFLAGRSMPNPGPPPRRPGPEPGATHGAWAGAGGPRPGAAASARQGWVDVELGVLGPLDPEIRSRPLTRMTMAGIARGGHPLFDGRIDARRYAAADHIGISRHGKRLGPIDSALAERGLRRRIAVVVPSHTSAMMLARDTDLVALTLGDWLPDATSALGLRTFAIPSTWHPSTSPWPGTPATRPTRGTAGSATTWRPPSSPRRPRTQADQARETAAPGEPQARRRRLQVSRRAAPRGSAAGPPRSPST